MAKKYRVGTRVVVPIGKLGKEKAYGKIIKIKKGKFKKRKILEYLIRFDDGDTGWFHSVEFRKEKKWNKKPVAISWYG